MAKTTHHCTADSAIIVYLKLVAKDNYFFAYSFFFLKKKQLTSCLVGLCGVQKKKKSNDNIMSMKCLYPFYYIVNATPTQYNLPYACATLEDPVLSNRLA